jgi:hypothetical protein
MPNIVRARESRACGQRWGNLCATGGNRVSWHDLGLDCHFGGEPSGVKQLHVVAHDLGGVLLDAVHVGPLAGLEATFDADGVALLQVLASDLGQAVRTPRGDSWSLALSRRFKTRTNQRNSTRLDGMLLSMSSNLACAQFYRMALRHPRPVVGAGASFLTSTIQSSVLS